jgi:ABC-type transport system substrate-binding protein
VGATGIALILATPGFAQTVTSQISSGTNAQTNALGSTSTGTGITVVNVTSQNGSAAVNQIGGLLPSPGVASPSVSVTTVNDTVGGFQLQQALDAGATATLGNTNNVAAIGASSLASSVTAAGNQSASGNLNTAAFATANLGTAPAQGSLIQALGTGSDGLTGPVGIISSNSISAQTTNGAATVGIAGTTTLQSASANINSALASPGSAGAILGLDQKVLNGGGVVGCDTPVGPRDQYRSDRQCAQDIAGAKKLLAEAGYPDGITFDLNVSTVESIWPTIAEVFQQQVAAAGIKVNIVQVPSDGYFNNVWMKRPVTMTRWNERPADGVLNEVYASGASWNESFFKDPKFDAILAAARRELDFDKRRADYIAAQDYLWDNGGTYVVFHVTVLVGLNPRVKGVDPVENFSIRWNKVTVD